MRKTLAITILHPFVSRNILQTDVFATLKNEKDLNLILIVPSAKEQYFKDIYGNVTNLKIVPLDVHILADDRKIRYLSNLSHLLMNYHYLWYKRIERLYSSKTIKSYIKYFSEKIFVFLFANKAWTRNIYRFIWKLFTKDEEVSKIFTLNNIDAVFCTDIFNESDAIIATEAKRRLIKTIGMIRSWDNCYSKGVMRMVPDLLIANNPTIKSEAIRMHDVIADSVEVCGLPQYDMFVNLKPTPRIDFMDKIHADAKKKTILFSPAGSILSDTDWQIAEILLDAIDSGAIDRNTQLLIRNHPHHPGDMTKIISRKGVVFDNPGKVISNRKEAELPLDEKQHLTDCLFHSDIVIYIATTLGNDSLIFDKPQIVVNFDGYENKKYELSVKRYHNEDHMKNMLDCGGVAIAKDKDDLIKKVNQYLANPKLDREGRLKALNQQVVFTDGRSGIRVAQSIIRVVNL